MVFFCLRLVRLVRLVVVIRGDEGLWSLKGGEGRGEVML